MLEEKLTAAKRELVEYAGLAESMVEKSIKGLLEKDRGFLDEVINTDEAKANDREVYLDDLCTSLIAQYEPKAKDLRTILMILKMNNDLERMGDHAVNIAHSALYLIERPPVKPLMDLPRMASVTVEMVKGGIMAFIDDDAARAKGVCEKDSIVDDLRDQLFRELITYMVSDARTIERSMHLIRIATNLERIADLATNMCEEVIFMVSGEVIKHGRIDDV
jgi:phosphate transport system protein